MKYTRGTNQFKKKYHAHWKANLIGFAVFTILLVVFAGLVRKDTVEKTYADSPMISPLADPTPTPIIDTTPENEKIVNEINQVFGTHANDAFRLLKCENGHLNPKAINDNTTWGGVGQDIGIFQINTRWQGVTNKAFLLDPSINIRMAYSIYSRDGYTFKLWTCGRSLGI